MEAEFKKGLYDYYENVVYKVKGYDYPAMYAAGRKRRLYEFDIRTFV